MNTWFVEEYILQSFEKWETITFNKISQKRDTLIKTLYEVYMWSLWRVDFVGILKHIIFSQHQVLFDLFIDLDWLTFITFSMYVCVFISCQHARIVGWRPNYLTAEIMLDPEKLIFFLTTYAVWRCAENAVNLCRVYGSLCWKINCGGVNMELLYEMTIQHWQVILTDSC